MRVTRDAFAVDTPRWFLGDSEFDMLGWHDWLLEQSVVPISPCNPRNTDDPPDIEYRVEERIKEHSDTVRLWQCQLDETYAERSRVETAIGVYKDLGLGTPHGSEAECASSHTSSSLFVSDWPSHSPITIGKTMSPAQPSRCENSSVPPPSESDYFPQ